MPRKSSDPPDLSGSAHGTVTTSWTVQNLVTTTGGGPGNWVTGYYAPEPGPDKEGVTDDVAPPKRRQRRRPPASKEGETDDSS